MRVLSVQSVKDAVEHAHRVLRLEVFADSNQVKRAYRLRAFDCHPDASGNAEAFDELQDAAEYLCRSDIRELWFIETGPPRWDPNDEQPPLSPPESDPAPRIAEMELHRIRNPRFRSLLALSVFGFVVAPHFKEMGLSWDPIPFHDFCEFMQSMDWVFFAAWLLIRKPAHKRFESRQTIQPRSNYFDSRET